MVDRRPTFRTILFFAVFVGLVAVLGAFKALQMTGLGAGMSTQRIVVASREIPEGAVIDRLAVTAAAWPRATVPPGAFSSIDSVVGRITRVAVFSGDPIVPARLAPAGSGPGLEVKIAAGKRAMGVRINDVAGISGLIQPNSRVDVLVTLRTDAAGQQRQVAKVYMENMRVLSVGRQLERDGDGEPIDATTATLEVAPDEAERLAVAMNQGSIQLVLRGYGDPSNVTTTGASSTDVLAQLRNARTAQLPASDVRPRERRVAPRPAPVRRAPAPVAAVVQSALAATPLPAMTPARPDSSVVRVYRGNELVVKKFEKVDSAAAAARKP
jgi:pilus assembly protein CpaB